MGRPCLIYVKGIFNNVQPRSSRWMSGIYLTRNLFALALTLLPSRGSHSPIMIAHVFVFHPTDTESTPLLRTSDLVPSHTPFAPVCIPAADCLSSYLTGSTWLRNINYNRIFPIVVYMPSYRCQRDLCYSDNNG